jgi:hypothetical protein
MQFLVIGKKGNKMFKHNLFRHNLGDMNFPAPTFTMHREDQNSGAITIGGNYGDVIASRAELDCEDGVWLFNVVLQTSMEISCLTEAKNVAERIVAEAYNSIEEEVFSP